MTNTSTGAPFIALNLIARRAGILAVSCNGRDGFTSGSLPQENLSDLSASRVQLTFRERRAHDRRRPCQIVITFNLPRRDNALISPLTCRWISFGCESRCLFDSRFQVMERTRSMERTGGG